MQVVEKTWRKHVAIKITFSLFFLQILQLAHMGQTEQFCLGMKRLEFQTIFAKSVLFFNTSPFSKKKLLMSLKGWSIWLFGERGMLDDLIQARTFLNPFIRCKCYFDLFENRPLILLIHVWIIRTRSIANVEGTIQLSRTQIVLESNDSLCRLEGQYHKW